MSRKPRHVSDQELLLAEGGDLTEGRAAQVSGHIAGCATCRRRSAELQDAVEAFAAARAGTFDRHIPAAGSSRGRLRDAMARAVSEAPRLAAGERTPALAVACALLAVMAAAYALARHYRASEPPREAARYAHSVPDPRLTPGLTDSRSLAEICSPEPQAPPPAVGRQVALGIFRSYGITAPAPFEYELDHLVPAELGGVTAFENLWPQPYEGLAWGASAKDALEARLLAATCGGEISLEIAQRDIAGDWVSAYMKYFGTAEPLVEHAVFVKDQPWH